MYVARRCPCARRIYRPDLRYVIVTQSERTSDDIDATWDITLSREYSGLLTIDSNVARWY